MPDPIVSFIVSVFNGENYLLDCINSINNQTYQDYEAIIVDDGSTDNTPVLLSELAEQNDRVKIIKRSNGGLTSALNLAISQSKGKYIARHDADDISSPYRIAQQVAMLEADQNAVLTSSHSVDFLDHSTLTALNCPPDDSRFLRETLMQGENLLVHGSILFRQSAFEKLQGGYRFRFAQDYDLYLRMLALGEFRIVPAVLYALRNHTSRIAVQSGELRQRIVRLIMQVNGLVAWDPEILALMKNGNCGNETWQILQEHILRSTPALLENRVQAQYYLSLIGDNFERRHNIEALTCALRALWLAPAWKKSWLSLPYAIAGIVLPQTLRSHLRAKGLSGNFRKPCPNSLNLAQLFDRMR